MFNVYQYRVILDPYDGPSYIRECKNMDEVIIVLKDMQAKYKDGFETITIAGRC